MLTALAIALGDRVNTVRHFALKVAEKTGGGGGGGGARFWMEPSSVLRLNFLSNARSRRTV